MISFFRRALSSWVVLGLLGLIMVAFIVTGVGTPGGLDQLAGGGTSVATVGRDSIAATDAAQRIEAQLDAERQQKPGLDMAAFVRSGQVDELIDQLINSRGFAEFGRQHGMVISKRLIDGEIANIAAFKGPTGQFDRNTFLGALAQRKLTEQMVRDDVAREKMLNTIIVPAAGAARAPMGLVSPYASLLLETRSGQVGFVPLAAMGVGAPPTEAEIVQFYQRNTGRYTVPETRVIRYALFDRSRFEGKVAATEAEIAAAYKAKEAQFASKETRTFTQVIVQEEAKARAIAAAAKAGTPLAVAAKVNGGEATTLAPQDQSEFAGLSSASLSRAAFAALKGAIVDPQKSGLGWHVIRVDAITTIGGKSLAEARAELSADIVKRKTDGAMADFVTKIEDAVADGSTFDDEIKAEGLTVVATPALTGGGIAPDDRNFSPAPELQPILKDAFQAEPDDDPSVVTIAQGQAYAFYDLDRVIPSAPKPLAAIRQQVTSDFVADRASRAARRVADAIAAKANQGEPLSAAIAASGVRLPAARPVSARRIDVTRAQQGKVPPALALLFSMAPNRTKVLGSPQNDGWFLVRLDKIVPGNAASTPGLAEATQRELSQAIGEEYVQQMASAIRSDLGVKKNDAAIKALKRSLSGATSQ
jgi:peptidyl-prolyl cis-trans isomerase D